MQQVVLGQKEDAIISYLFVAINGCKMMSEVISYEYHNNIAIVNCFGHENLIRDPVTRQ